MERSIYANVLAIMAVFIGLFSLFNLNITAYNNMPIKTLITLNCVTIGSVTALIAAIQTIVSKKKNRVLFIMCIVAYLASIVIQWIPFT